MKQFFQKLHRNTLHHCEFINHYRNFFRAACFQALFCTILGTFLLKKLGHFILLSRLGCTSIYQKVFLLSQSCHCSFCYQNYASAVNFSSGQLNLVKTFHNDTCNPLITKIALECLLDIFGQRRQTRKNPYFAT